MPALSKFHSIYENNKIVIDDDARSMTQYDFMRKYKIGTTMYLMYFKGVSEAMKRYKVHNQNMRNAELRERHENIMKKARAKQDECLNWFNDKVNSIAIKFDLPVEYILFLTKDYCISEIEHGRIEDGKLIVCDEIKMADPGDITNSMSGRFGSMV